MANSPSSSVWRASAAVQICVAMIEKLIESAKSGPWAAPNYKQAAQAFAVIGSDLRNFLDELKVYWLDARKELFKAREQRLRAGANVRDEITAFGITRPFALDIAYEKIEEAAESAKLICLVESGDGSRQLIDHFLSTTPDPTGAKWKDLLSLMELESRDAEAALATPAGAAGQGEGGDRRPSNRSRKRLGGKPPLSETEERKRLEILKEWWQAKGAGTKQKDFCRDRGITVKTLQRYVNWHGTRKSRNTN